MRIGEVARLARVSARTIRHYHRIGALPEPPRTPGGYREYDVADLVRIVRIAFLSDSGVPLRDVRAHLDSSASTDLDALRAHIDARIQRLTLQRARLDAIAERAAAGLPPGLLPAEVARALDACRADAARRPDPAELLALIDRERDLLDLLALSTDFPEVLAESYARIGSETARRAAYLDLLAGFHALEGRPVADAEDEITRLADTLAADPALRVLLASPPPGPDHDADDDSAGPTPEQLLPDPAQREVVRRVLAAAAADEGGRDR
ncbi:MerR family transcriptional regulator [Dietzia sp. 179-F 9C3 NHS]|uniref:MerR family transcriptional regulator n=1 Tax=Dietzia sp. 179-F 9C3 NHS TaxID=3374295 RepID=UPI00387942A0